MKTLHTMVVGAFQLHRQRVTLGWRLLMACLILIGLGAILPVAAQAQDAQRCFKETGYCISGSIREYWEKNGGLSVFGYPISDVRVETLEGRWTGPVQWFERDRLEAHHNEGLGVLAGRLGARYLELQGRPWSPGRGATAVGDCRVFSQTGYALCGQFRSYWERNGGLERFGYPITAASEETIEGRNYIVQYFERRRMEYHPENAGTPYEMLLGLLGREVFAREGGIGAEALRYYWPSYVPPELSTWAEGSYTTESMWVLQLAQPHATEPALTISGNVGGGLPGRKLSDVTVRGFPGTAFASGSGYAVLWTEQGKPYSVVGKRDLTEILRIAEGLELIDRATWERRLRPEEDGGVSGLRYYWPTNFPLELSVMPMGSYITERMWSLQLGQVHATEPDLTINGGVAGGPPGRKLQDVTVRGQPGIAFTGGTGYAVLWNEQNQPYVVVGNRTLSEILSIAEGLELIDRATWERRLRPE
jgi:hypothetical protein